MLYAMKNEFEDVIHCVDTDSMRALCGISDMGLGATGSRDFDCPGCLMGEVERARDGARAEVDRLRAILESIGAMTDPGDVQTPSVLRMGLLWARQTAWAAIDEWVEEGAAPLPRSQSPLGKLRSRVEDLIQERNKAREACRRLAALARRENEGRWTREVERDNALCLLDIAYKLEPELKRRVEEYAEEQRQYFAARLEAPGDYIPATIKEER